MTELQKEYIITENQIKTLTEIIKDDRIITILQSRPYTNVEKVLDDIVSWYKTLSWTEAESEPNISVSSLIKKIAELRARECDPSFYENERERTHP